eukprot:UN27902
MMLWKIEKPSELRSRFIQSVFIISVFVIIIVILSLVENSLAKYSDKCLGGKLVHTRLLPFICVYYTTFHFFIFGSYFLSVRKILLLKREALMEFTDKEDVFYRKLFSLTKTCTFATMLIVFSLWIRLLSWNSSTLCRITMTRVDMVFNYVGMLWAGQKTEGLKESNPVLQLNLEKYYEDSDSDISDTITDGTSDVLYKWQKNIVGQMNGGGAFCADVHDSIIQVGDEKISVVGMLCETGSLGSSTTFLDPALLITNSIPKST